MQARPLFILAAMTAVTPSQAQAPAGQALNAKLQETLMGPSLTGSSPSQIVMSEDGDHLAIVTAKGSRQVVLLDGVEGPLFDEIPDLVLRPFQIAVQFSPTGGRSAYLGRRGGDLIAVIDGKEAGAVASSQPGMTVSGSFGWMFWFNRDGSKVAYAGISAPQSYIMVADGVKGPPYRAIDVAQTLLNGKRLVYVAQTADQLWHAVVDGKPGPGYVSITSLKLTPDGAHYGYLAIRAGGGGPGLPMLSVAVVDGVESKAYLRIDGALEQAPDGRVAYVAATTPSDGRLVVAGQDIPGSCGPPPLVTCVTFGNRLSGAGPSPQAYVAFSPDGKGFAYIRTNRPNPGVTVIANGKPMGPTYTQAHYLSWSPDGSRFAYVGQSPTGWFPVVDGEELSGYSNVLDFQFSPDGKRYAFVGQDPAKGMSVVVDGKEQTKPGSEVGSLRFSPDGKHVAFAARATVRGYQPIVDGVALPHNLGNFVPIPRINTMFPVFYYSEDGNHLAYVANNMDGTNKGAVYVDGARYEAPIANFTFPSFSPDGKHFATVITAGTGWTVMVDGKLGPLYQGMLKTNIAACRFVNDRTYRFYGIKGGQIYRVTLDIS